LPVCCFDLGGLFHQFSSSSSSPSPLDHLAIIIKMSQKAPFGTEARHEEVRFTTNNMAAFTQPQVHLIRL
jgi:hypothetical protein